MGTEQDKWPREQAAFLEFIQLAGIPVNPRSIHKRPPPEPDLLCEHKLDGPIAFELVEICDSALAEALAQPEQFRFIPTRDPSLVIVRKKLRKAYSTPHPIELLCYTDGRVVTPPDVLVPTLTPLVCSLDHSYRRVWLLAEGTVHLLHVAEA